MNTRCIVCAKKSIRGNVLFNRLCEPCDTALVRWSATEHAISGSVHAWIARRVRTHERARMNARALDVMAEAYQKGWAQGHNAGIQKRR